MTDDPGALIDPLPSGAAVEYIRESVDYEIHELSGTGGIYAIAVEGVAAISE